MIAPSGSPGEPNFLNRTLWSDDNLKVLRGINSECIDLVCLDPPFNSKRFYNAPLGSDAAGAQFVDTWTMDQHEGRMDGATGGC